MNAHEGSAELGPHGFFSIEQDAGGALG